MQSVNCVAGWRCHSQFIVIVIARIALLFTLTRSHAYALFQPTVYMSVNSFLCWPRSSPGLSIF